MALLDFMHETVVEEMRKIELLVLSLTRPLIGVIQTYLDLCLLHSIIGTRTHFHSAPLVRLAVVFKGGGFTIIFRSLSESHFDVLTIRLTFN